MLKLIYEAPPVTDLQEQNSSVLTQLSAHPILLLLSGPTFSSSHSFLLPLLTKHKTSGYFFAGRGGGRRDIRS